MAKKNPKKKDGEEKKAPSPEPAKAPPPQGPPGKKPGTPGEGDGPTKPFATKQPDGWD